MVELEKSSGHFYYGKSNGVYGNFSEANLKEFKVSPVVSLYLYKISSLVKEYGIISLNQPYAMSNEAFEDNSHLYSGAKEVAHDIYRIIKEKGLLN